MSRAIDHLEHIRGETINFGLRSAAYLGTEAVTCAVKLARNSFHVPPSNENVVLNIAPTFVAASGDELPAWHFEITASESASLDVGGYILDAKVVFAAGHTDITEPLGLRIKQGVTS